MLTNIFFFILFSSEPDKNLNKDTPIHPEQVEVQIEAQLLTPFQIGKKVLLVNRQKRIKVEGVMRASLPESLDKYTVLVHEQEAAKLFQHQNWEILPFLKNLTFAAIKREKTHEIHY